MKMTILFKKDFKIKHLNKIKDNIEKVFGSWVDDLKVSEDEFMTEITDSQIYLAQSLLIELGIRSELPNARKLIEMALDTFEDMIG